MHASDTGEMSEDAFERRLRHSLYRFDCPDAQTLGEYGLGLLEAAEGTRIAAHTLDCPDCTTELATFRAYVSMDTPVSEPLVERARRIVATLFTPRPGLAYGGLRGANDPATRVYEAGDVTLTLGPGSSSGEIVGLVVAGDTPPAALEARSVRLLPGSGEPIQTRLDDLGNFEFADVDAGTYALEIDLPQGIVVIEDFRVD